MDKVVLIGYDLEIIDLLTVCKKDIVGYIDIVEYKNREKNRIKYLGNDHEGCHFVLENKLNTVISINNPSVRKRLFHLYNDSNITIISPMSYISPISYIEKGSIIQHGVKVFPEVKIGKGCLLNVNSTVHHESQIGDFSILAPASLVLGRVIIGNNVYIGAGAIIREGVKIGDNVIIGAGAVVLNDIPPNSIVVGVPARRYLKKLSKLG